MKEYIIVKLDNNKKYLIIDNLKYQNKDYFLVTEVIDKKISDNYKVCLYDYNNNCFKKIENNEELDFITLKFETNIKNKSVFEEIFDFDKFLKLKIVNIDNYDYSLQYENGEITTKNIEFYLSNKPQINDYIYILEEVLKENNILQYGYIKNLNEINYCEIIKVVSSNYEYYYQRYYG